MKKQLQYLPSIAASAFFILALRRFINPLQVPKHRPQRHTPGRIRPRSHITKDPLKNWRY